MDHSLVAGLLARLRSLSRGLFRRADIEAEMREEFSYHLELQTEDLVRRGLPREEAARQARIEFGHVETHQEAARASRGLHIFDQIRFSWLDVRLALRLLAKHPLLTAVAVFALAVGIPVGLAPSHLARALEAPLPGDPEDRIRAIRYWDPLTSSVAPTDADAFQFWADGLTSFSSVAAFRTSTYSVTSTEGLAAAVTGAQLSGSAFDILGITPELGRPLVAADGAPGAPAAVVIGHDLWTSRFGSDPAVVGSILRIGRVPYTVVGVMPPGFRFPAHEQLWLPLQTVSVTAPPHAAPVQIFGRLAPGVSANQAQAELRATGDPPTSDLPEARLRLQPEVVPFGLLFLGIPRSGLGSLPEFHAVQLLAVVLLLVACGNVAMLIFARTATRFRELAVRTALGASRSRIVSQIFVEALVLAVAAAVIGVGSIHWALGHLHLAAIPWAFDLPYWLTLDVTGTTLLQAVVLAAVSATVAGVVPALRITGVGIQQSIRSAEAGKSGVRFGGLTSGLVAADIAIAVIAVGLALAMGKRATDGPGADALTGIPAAEYLAVEVSLPDGGWASPGETDQRRRADQLARAQRALVAALQGEPGVTGVAVADALPRMEHRSRPIEIEGVDPSTPNAPRWVRTARVDVGFFDALGQRAIAGRLFDRTDTATARPTAIVNTAFVDEVFGGRDPIGHRVRFPSPTGQGEGTWHEVVGVVGPLGVNVVSAQGGRAVYLPASPGEINPLQLGIHASVSPSSLVPRVRALVASVDLDLVLGATVVLSEVHQADWYLMIAMAGGLALVVGVLILLATSGIYAMLSFSVSERTREIGIRTALGASRRQLVLVMLRRSLAQMAVGTAIGLPIATWIVFAVSGTEQGGSIADAALVAFGLAGSMVGLVGIVACMVPVRRILAIEASEALRAEG